MLSQWMYFWDWDSAPSSASAATVTSLSNDGGARGRDYHPLPDEFWEEYGLKLKQDKPKDIFSDPKPVEYTPAPPNAQKQALIALKVELAAGMAQAQTVDDLKVYASRMQEIDKMLKGS